MDYAKKVIKDSNLYHGGFPFHTAYRDAESTILYSLLRKLMIDNCKDKNPKNESWRGKTPLHFAVIYNDLETCQFIIENIQNINPRDYDGNTPLHIATEYRLENLCQLIIENIQNVNPKNNFGTTP